MRVGAQGQTGGEAIFTAKCAACHTVGGGKLLGPDLAGVTTRRDKAWLARWIKEPDKMLAEKDATAVQLLQEYNNVPMTNMGLTDSEVAQVIAYLGSFDAGAAPAPVSPAPQLVTGDAERGKALFLGAAHLDNGGPSCMACHSVAGIGALGGGALGADLTDILDRYGGEAGLTAFLANPATPTMNAVWSSRSMTGQERADLVAFFGSTSVAVRPPSMLWTLAALAGVVAAVVAGVAAIVWRKRLRGVRKPMVQRATAKS